MSGYAKENRSKHSSFVNRGGAGGYRDWFVVSGSRVSVEWSVEYMEYDAMTTALEIMDWYIDHYTELEHIDTVRKLKEIRADMENAGKFGGRTN